MKRVLIIGCPGSGKSTLAWALHQRTGLPLVHLDMLYWNADRTTAPPEVFREKLEAALREAAWIIDGNYASTIDMRMQACDTVIFLDYPVELCLQGIRERRGKARADMPWIEREDEEDVVFAAFVRNFQTQSRPQVMALLERYAHKTIYIWKSRDEADEFLCALPENSA